MIKVFYFYAASPIGRLRAVLLDSLHVIRLASSQAFTYLGDGFPQQDFSDPPAAVIEILPGTRETGWPVGFYRAEQPPHQFEETLQRMAH
jgi:hypothetical protein